MSDLRKPILVMGKVSLLPSLRWEVELSVRALAAAALYHQSRCPILTFEAPFGDDILSGSELVKAILQDAGVADEDIVQSGQSTSTTEELMLANQWLERHQVSQLRIITSDYHVPRVIQKVKRLDLDGVDVLSPESIAKMQPNGFFSDIIISGKNTRETHRKERPMEHVWLISDYVVALIFPNAVHENIETIAGRCLRQMTRFINLRRQRDWKSN